MSHGQESGALDGGGKTMRILGDRWWPQAAKQEGEGECWQKVSMYFIETTK